MLLEKNLSKLLLVKVPIGCQIGVETTMVPHLLDEGTKETRCSRRQVKVECNEKHEGF